MANDSVEGCTCDAERRLITAVEVEPTEVAGGLLDAQYPPENGIWTVVVSNPLNIHDLVAGIGAYVFERQIHTALDDNVADPDADRDDPILTHDRLPTIRRSSTQERAANRGRRGPDSC